MPIIQVAPASTSASVYSRQQVPFFTDEQIAELSYVIALSLNERLETENSHATPFDLPDCRYMSPSIPTYLMQLVYFLKMSEVDLLVMYVFIERYLTKTNNVLTSNNIHFLLAISAMVAYKYGADENIVHQLMMYPRISRVTREEINRLEVQFLSDIGYEISVLEYPYLMVKAKLINFAQDGRVCRLRQSQSCLSLHPLEQERLNELQQPQPLNSSLNTHKASSEHSSNETRGASYTPRLFSSARTTVYRDSTVVEHVEESPCCCWW